MSAELYADAILEIAECEEYHGNRIQMPPAASTLEEIVELERRLRLARHIARLYDPTPLTWTLCLKAGFRETMGGEALVLRFTDCTDNLSLAEIEFESRIWLGVRSLKWARNRHSRIAALETLGDLRRLCESLGIELKEDGDAK